MSGETRKLTTILAADVAGYSRLAAADEERTLARLRALRSDLIDPAISLHHGRVVKRTGDGILIEFRSVVDAVRCAIEVQNGMVERNAGLPPERQIQFRVGLHLGDVVEEADGDLMGDGVNIAARLENICEPGAICLSEDAYRQVRSRLDLAVADLGDKELKNIPEPVHVFSLEVGKPAQAKVVGGPAKPMRRGALVPILAAVAVLALVVGAGAWYLFMRSDINLAANQPSHLSIVVLPFANLSNDPKQDYFADGITENLTTDLSRIRNSFVIARNTAFTYKGKNVDAKEIGKELGVRYVLEGSVQRDGNRVRVNAQLIDAESGAHLWADRFEEDLSDLFKLQDEVVARLANTLGYELTKAEAAKAAHSSNPDAIDLTMRGLALLLPAAQTKESNNAARNLFQQALAIDPNESDALAGLANTFLLSYDAGWDNSHVDYDAKVIGLADRAIALNPASDMAYTSKATYLSQTKRPTEAMATVEAGLEHSPSNASLYDARALVEISLGRYEPCRTDVLQAIRLSPRDPLLGGYHTLLAAAEQLLGNDDMAVEDAREAIQEGYRAWYVYAHLAASLAFLGKSSEAASALSEARRVNPALTIKWAMAHTANEPRFFDGLRLAGLPEDDGPRLSIVVLPFQNLSGDAKQDYLADVLTDELTTYISRIPGSFVIARNTAFTFKGKPTDAKEIGKDLGVRYMLEGSVQPTDRRIRTNAQLIDTETGAHLWAEEFDTDKADLLQTEDDIVTSLARNLQVKLTDIESAKLLHAQPGNPDAQTLALRCEAELFRGWFGKRAQAAFDLCDQSLRLDQNNVTALTGAAGRFIYRVITFQTLDRSTDLSRADELATRALTVDPNDPGAHAAKAWVLQLQNQFAEAEAEAHHAIVLNPSDMDAYAALCTTYYFSGQPKKILDCDDEALRLSPRDPGISAFFAGRVLAYFIMGQYEQAIEWSRKTLAVNPNWETTYAFLAASLALAGHDSEAHTVITHYLSMPGTKTKTIMALKKIINSNNPVYLATRERLYEGLRKAGMPEQ